MMRSPQTEFPRQAAPEAAASVFPRPARAPAPASELPEAAPAPPPPPRLSPAEPDLVLPPQFPLAAPDSVFPPDFIRSPPQKKRRYRQAMAPCGTRGAVFPDNGEPRPLTPGGVPLSAIPPHWCDEEGYPFKDGVPMAEGDRHFEQLVRVHEVLRARYRGEGRRGFVGGNLFLYYREGERIAKLSPDAFVVLGASQLPRRYSWKVWKEGRGPDWVLEVLSKSTRGRDEGEKAEVYLKLKVGEYWLFEPEAERLKMPWIRGLRRVGGKWRSLHPDDAGVYRSEVLGLELREEGGELRFRDADTGEDLVSYEESIAAKLAADEARCAEAKAHQRTRRQLSASEARAAAAEARIAELEAVLRGE